MRVLEVSGLWAAALVGLLAIFMSSEDTKEQRGIMQSQIDATLIDQRPWVFKTSVTTTIRQTNPTGNSKATLNFALKNTGQMSADKLGLLLKVSR